MHRGPPPRRPPPPITNPPKNMAPQEIMDRFWTKFHTRHPGKVTSIFPRSMYASLLPPAPQQTGGASSARNAAESYEKAAAECRAKVARIRRECERTNEKFTDPDFDVESDLQPGLKYCLYGLLEGDCPEPVTPREVADAIDVLGRVPPGAGKSVHPLVPSLADDQVRSFGVGALRHVLDPDSEDEGPPSYRPKSVHRVDWIFDKPAFTVDGFSSSDIEQGAIGDCWFMAAVANIAHRRDLMDRVCVAKDEECGVYGFVFHRDGEWISTVIDDNLYLSKHDFDDEGDTYDPAGKREQEHKERWQSGSKALYFGRCTDPNETWLPLLEKAFAKAHGDYSAITGGAVGDGMEDLTGGVNTALRLNRVLKKDKLWKELLQSSQEGSEFVFALSKWSGDDSDARNGLTTGHAYSVIDAREEEDKDGTIVRLVKIRNPWGSADRRGVGEWKGPWSDGSKNWNTYWIDKLGHTFGDDGVFWMSYDGMRDHFDILHRTRVFDKKWTIVQQWTSTNVAWVTGYLQTKFIIDLKTTGQVVIVLCQLDDRYFKGLRGQYWFDLHFVLQKEGCDPGDFICRVRAEEQHRSVSCEIHLEAGKYEVIPKVTATRVPGWPLVEDVVKMTSDTKPQKLRQIGMQYDLAHAKGGVTDEDGALEKKRADAKAKIAEQKRKMKEARQRRAMMNAARQMNRTAKGLRKAAHEGKRQDEKKHEKQDEKDADDIKDDKKDEKAEHEDDAKEDSETVTKDACKGDDEKALDEGQGAESNAGLDTNKLLQHPTPEPDSKHEAAIPSQHDILDSPGGHQHHGHDDASGHNDREGRGGHGGPQGGRELSWSMNEEMGGDFHDARESPSEAEDLPREGSSHFQSDGEQFDGPEGEDDDYMYGGPSASGIGHDHDAHIDDDGVGGPKSPWNAVCVMGLRVYAQDPDVTIALVKPDTMTEATSLTVTNTPAGATM